MKTQWQERKPPETRPEVGLLICLVSALVVILGVML